MRKEIIIAIFVGIVFGGIFAFGIRRANVALKPAEENTSTNQLSEENTSEENLPDNLSILSPEQNDVFTESTITITGITKPDSTIVISAEGEDFVITSDATGEFEQEIELNGGLNNILVSSFEQQNTIGEEVLKIVYTTKIDI